ncbi:MAG: helix-turn-helix domain-containing protein [Bacteroidetes bacterium]|jgi:AraC-like DNA-binding protein|nr:helix-turn-helix domain-containing protein [Bacteroidota bacterium]
MDFKEYKPPKELSHLIECYWSNTMHPEDFNQDHDLIIPDGSAEAIFMVRGSYYRDDEKNNKAQLIDECSFVTPFSRAVKVYQKPHTSCFAIRFKPEGVQILTGTSLGDLDRPAYPLQEVMPELADLAMNGIMKNTPIHKIVSLISEWLLKQELSPVTNAVVNEFTRRAILQKGQIEIRGFCAEFNLHKSTLQKNFKQITGYTPKEYAGIIRFNYLLNRMLFSTNSLTETSHELGYFDQSHMIRDFRKVTGTSPTKFIERGYTIPQMAAFSTQSREGQFTAV